MCWGGPAIHSGIPVEAATRGQAPATGVSLNLAAPSWVLRELALSKISILLLGEPGTGKRTTAEQIHLLSPRRKEAFVGVSCATLTPQVFQDLANESSSWMRGTVFLKEVKELSPICQSRLLEALPVPSAEGAKCGAGLIFGSTSNLELEVQAGRFREDLYYRISRVCLRLPPLRQRKEDIPSLVNFFLSKYAAEWQLPMPVLSPDAEHFFQEYSWPGNVRELEGAVKAIAVLGEAVAMHGLRSLLSKPEYLADGERISLKQVARSASRDAERGLILKVLTRTNWNRRRAAQDLQISYKALLYKLKQTGLEDNEAS